MLTRLGWLLCPDARWLAIGVVLDLLLGDPVYRYHPVRLIGSALDLLEERLRRFGCDGHAGGVLLFAGLTLAVLATLGGILLGASVLSPALGPVAHVLLVWSFLALGDLLRHVWRVEAGAGRADLAAARSALSALVGRDTDRLDVGGCRRAAVESLSENFTDGFVSPLFWYVLAGLPGLAVFKVVSTMDSMVGYKTPRYLRFGWCGARLDDAMNFLPARITWMILTAVAAVLPGCSCRNAWQVGLGQHSVVPGPNSGWPEAAAAGALRRQIAGPIWKGGTKVAEVWIGHVGDPPLESRGDLARAVALVASGGLLASALAVLSIIVLW